MNLKELKIRLDSVEAVQRFSNVIGRYEGIPIDISVGRYVIDARSIMGIFSIDLSKVLSLSIHADSSTNNINTLLAELKQFEVNYS